MATTILSRHRVLNALCIGAALTAASGVRADDASAWRPQTAFVQGGIAADVRTVVIGATWSSAWKRPWAGGLAELYWELSFGRWETQGERGPRSSAWVTQLGVTPVLRWHPSGDSPWFAEAGIGANVLLPLYRSRDKRFSTAFNFGDHVAVGRRFGERGEQELALRLQHFSNAGIKHPNPGENFLQLRYARAF